MSDITDDPGRWAKLRQDAQQKLLAGVTPPSRGSSVGVDALTLLHRLASAPDSAADALKLLHELQVHQVELDMQQAQLEASERELGDDLARYRAFFDHTPVASFVLDARGRIEVCNQAAGDLLGASCIELGGRRFDEFLSSESRLPLAALLRDARAGANRPFRSVGSASGPAAGQRWRLAASLLPASDAILVVVIEDPDPPEG